jgi:hypothetical protein
MSRRASGEKLTKARPFSAAKRLRKCSMRAEVFAALAQRRQVEPEHVEPVVEVLPEELLLHHLREVAVGRRDDAGVHGDLLRAADGTHLALLERAQELHLQRQRHLAHLVEEERAPVGLAKHPDVLLEAPVNEPFSWPKSSLSTRSAGMAPQLTTTKGPELRSLLVWMARAKSSLPVPLSPVMSTLARLGAERRTNSIAVWNAGLRPMSEPPPPSGVAPRPR